ncbi:hypothetical protein HPB51_020683 [Rhipicephalus microplus]|uniref:Uncharacterized protein n=1 Tax=Rhipicephalus microplus TaxID=6941 RepID=A0A9J6EUM5_RHIMP|nr:hypothetical protein HPB51_020683 [Rhipicephalus microplus]
MFFLRSRPPPGLSLTRKSGISGGGEDKTPEEVTEDQGWQPAGARRAGACSAGANFNGVTLNETKSTTTDAPRGCNSGNTIKARIIFAGRMPQLPREDTRIVIRPRRGLNIVKTGCGFSQIVVTAYDTVPTQIVVMGRTYEVSAYEAAPHSTWKGVIPGVPLVDGPNDIDTCMELSPRIVRQELEAMAPAPYKPPAQDNWATVSLIQAVVRQEFANLGVQVPQPARLMPQPMSTPVHNTEHRSAPLVAAAAATLRFPPRYRNPS